MSPPDFTDRRAAARPRTANWLAVTALWSLLPAAAAAQCELAELQTAGGSANAGLGTAVAIHGGHALVGVPEPGVFDSTGTVRGFEKTVMGWQDRGPIKPLLPVSDDRFGAALATEVQYAVVGAPGHSALSVDGSAYVFERIGSVWSQLALLEPALPAARDAFGTSVSILGNRVLIGAPGNQLTHPGRAYVFERDPLDGSWSEAAELVPANGQPFDGFGTSVSLGPDRAVIGAPNGTLPGPGPQSTGTVHVFEFAGGTWQEVDVVEPPDGKSGDAFGSSVSLDGNRLATGAPNHKQQGVPRGAVYVFRKGPGGWWIESIPAIVPGVSTTALGSSVTLAGNQLVAGDPAVSVQGLPGAGRMHGFRYTGSIWIHVSVLEPGSPKFLGGFGSSLDQESALVLCGSLDPFGPGAAHVFSLSLNDCPALEADVTGISVSGGGVQQLDLSAGSTNAGRPFLVLGSLSGTAPGLIFDGLVLPLNTDAYFYYRVVAPHLPPISGGLGILNAQGTATAQVSFPAGSAASLAGIELHHAFVVLNPLGSGAVAFSSNAVPLALMP